jgi:hypothetical protein
MRLAAARPAVQQLAEHPLRRSAPLASQQDGGTWSRSMTKTKEHKGEISSRTKSMAHEPGGAPVKSTTGINVGQ